MGRNDMNKYIKDTGAAGKKVLVAGVSGVTPTEHNVPFRAGDFATLTEALDYASNSQTGMNFYNGRGEVNVSLTYGEIHQQSLDVARRMQRLDLPRGSKVALIADTTPDFVIFFFGCQYAGLVPVPLPAIVNVGGREAFVKQMQALLQDCQARVAVASEAFVEYLEDACVPLQLSFKGTYNDFRQLPEDLRPLQPLNPDEVAYVQYTSGSTRTPRGVMVQSKAVMANLKGIIQHGVNIDRFDRSLSWLPFYHDMGLVGLVLMPVAAQCSVDYLGTREFAVRPRLWLQLLSETKATLSYSPPFGYELCARRLRNGGQEKYDLSNWRVAGVGAEMIREEVLMNFYRTLKPSGFNLKAFVPCYGMAESALSVSFPKLEKKFGTDEIDREKYAVYGLAIKAASDTRSRRSFVSCGFALPDHEIQIRDNEGHALPERHTGTVFVRGPSLMCGYLNQSDITQYVLTGDGEDKWLNTGDLGYMVGEELFVTGRHKDLIIINGRNIWPQDLEHVAESQPGIRSGDALAFSFSEKDEDPERAVLVIQSRETDLAKRAQLKHNVECIIREEFAINCQVNLVPNHTLPRTSSGKLSRSKARDNFKQSNLTSNIKQISSL